MNVFLRALTVYTAVVTLSVANLWPVAVRAAEGVSAAVSSSKCCCGTADGRCCSMACCRAPLEKGDSSPVRGASAEWSAPPFLLSDRPALLAGRRSRSATGRFVFDRRSVADGESLLARHVLLQV